MMHNNFNKLEKILSSDNDFLEKIKAISETIKTMLHADRCTIFIHDPETKSFWSAYIEGLSYIELPDNTGIVHEIFTKDKAYIFNKVQHNLKYNHMVSDDSGYLIHSMIAAPIIDEKNKSIGVIQVINKLDNNHDFSESDKEIVMKLLHHINHYTKNLR